MPGKVECAYVEVQMVRRITRRREEKLKRAVCGETLVRGARGRMEEETCHFYF
jgi:hypothetical protein